MPVVARDRLAVKSVVAPQDPGLYRALLPPPLRMPDEPRLLVEFVRFGPRWHEASLSMACRYDGEEGWHGLYWAIDSRVPYRMGRLIGYPKRMVERMELVSSGEGARGQAHDAGRTVAHVAFDGREPPAGADTVRGPAREQPYFMLVPPAEGPAVNRVAFRETHAPSTAVTVGAAEICFDVDAPWRGLIPDPGVFAPAKLFTQSGRSLGFLIASRV
ncbi:MAG: acetoacetate decarboxylase family protein [Myxococcota bacterium]